MAHDEGRAVRVGLCTVMEDISPEAGRPRDAEPRAAKSGEPIPRAGGSVPGGGPILHGGELLTAALAAVARAPRAAALFCDIDGTISPIVADPFEAVVPDAFRAALAALAPRLGLLAFVTGRDVRQARAMVGVEGAAYVGLHGFDVLGADGTIARDPSAAPYVEAVQRMARRVRALDAERLGLVVENKGPMLDLHYRKAADPAATLAELETEILGPARDLGLAVATGHFLVELRPPEPVDKGTAVLSLLRDGQGEASLRTAVFLGDDLTDRHGFEAVHDWAAARDGRHALAVAALTVETPHEVKEAADVWVAATPGMAAVLDRLLEAAGAQGDRPGPSRRRGR